MAFESHSTDRCSLSPLISAVRARLPWLVLASVVAVSGCGGGDSAVDEAGSRGNSFPPNKNAQDDFNSGSTGDSNNTSGLAANEVRVTVEVPTALAPDGELTRRNLRIVTPDRVEVYRTDQSLRNLGSVDVTYHTEDGGRQVIAFSDGLPLGPDVVIEAVYDNVRMRALAADSDRDVKVNPFSEYLVSNTINGYSPDQFSQIMDCVNDASGELCLNKYVWSTLADQVHDFEIDIPGSADLGAALDHLDNRGDFARYVSNMADYAVLDEQSSGKISASSADYNSVFLGVELGQTFREPSLAGSGQWGVRTAQEESITDSNGTGYVYPALTLTSFDAFNIRVTSLASDVPYTREALIHQAGNGFYPRGADHWDLNTHASSPGAATLQDNIRLLAGRALYQSVTGRGSSLTIGWTRNPYYLDAYVSTTSEASEAPDRVLGGYFSAGKAIELEAKEDALQRQGVLEDHYLSVLELNLLRQHGFSLDQLNGRQYNAVFVASRFADGAEPLAIESGVGNWEISGNDIHQLMTTTTIGRDGGSGAVTGPVAGNRNADWTISVRPSRLSVGDRNIGRLNLDISNPSGQFATPDLGIGASTPDGSLLAFNLDNADTGDGVLVAGAQTNEFPQSGRFRLQGFAMGLADGENRLRHFDNAVLAIDSSTTAALTGRALDVVHSVANETVAGPMAIDEGEQMLAYSQGGNGEVTFVAGDLTLTGFVTPDQDQFFLQLQNTASGEQRLGLLIATRLPN